MVTGISSADWILLGPLLVGDHVGRTEAGSGPVVGWVGFVLQMNCLSFPFFFVLFARTKKKRKNCVCGCSFVRVFVCFNSCSITYGKSSDFAGCETRIGSCRVWSKWYCWIIFFAMILWTSLLVLVHLHIMRWFYLF